MSKLVIMETPVTLKALKTRFKPDKILELMQAIESLERRSLISINLTQHDTFYQYNRLIRNYLNRV